MNFTVTAYMTIEAANNKDAQAFADELKEYIAVMPDSKHGSLFPESVNVEKEEEED